MQMSSEDIERNWFWIGTDRSNQIAVFQTSGKGLIPASLRNSISDAEFIDEYVDSALRLDTGRCNGEISEAACEFAWFNRFRGGEFEKKRLVFLEKARQAASAGVYSYDVQLQSGRPVGYFQLAYPTIPRTIDSLPAEVQSIARRIAFSQIDFRSTLVVTADIINGCGSSS